MSVLQKLASHLVSEVPVAKLRDLFRHQLNDGPMTGGVLCGGGCAPVDSDLNGFLCGFNCRPTSGPMIVDTDGALGLTAEDLASLRDDIPSLRRAVAYQIEQHLNQLR